MKLLEDRILQEGQVRPGNILKVDCFFNHQLDVELLSKIGEEFYRIFKDDGINKILTIEASGIAIACMTAQYFKVPVVFAKKAKSKNIDGDVFTSKVQSFTYGKEYDINLVPKIKLETVVCEIPVERVLEVAEKVLKTGKLGDGKIFVYKLSDAVRIRTGDRGEDAIKDEK